MLATNFVLNTGTDTLMIKKKLLIVEDEAIVALNLANLVTRLGYKVVKVVDTGDSAIEAALETELDVILMDVRLKGKLAGTEAARIIRQTSDVAIVFLTAYSDETTFKDAMGAQSYGFLIKPFDERQLNIAIQLELHKREVDRKLRIQSRQMSQIVNSVPDGIMLIDNNRTIQHINLNAVQYLEVIKNVIDCDDIEKCLHSSFFAELIDTTASGSWYEVVATDPNYQVFELQVCPLSNQLDGSSEDNTNGWILIIRDQTRQKLANQRLSHQEKLATIGQLAAGIAHDFNNILASIMIQTDLMILKSDDIPDYHKAQLQKNKHSLNRAKQLINQILDFGRTSSPETQTIELATLLQESTDMFEPLLTPSIQMSHDLISDTCVVDVNKSQLIQVFMNLFLNARDAMSQKGGRLKITLTRTRIQPESSDITSGEWARVTIDDTGIGMTDDVAKHVFEPFFTTKFAHGGTGLGLSQVYGIVQQHNGFIDFSSKINEGTQFSIFLPLAQIESNFPKKLPKSIAPNTSRRILVVEDDIPARETLCEVLQISHFDVVAANDGQEALNILASDSQFDVILSDINMPIVNGIQLYKEVIRKNYEVQFAFMTGYVSEDRIRQNFSEKVNILKKPFSADELLNLLEMISSNEEDSLTAATK